MQNLQSPTLLVLVAQSFAVDKHRLRKTAGKKRDAGKGSWGGVGQTSIKINYNPNLNTLNKKLGKSEQDFRQKDFKVPVI